MDKTFQSADVEQRINALWVEARAFDADRPDRLDAPPFTVVIPPPNVTGVLHMGHALNNTLQDILCRYQRMRGRNVLWQPGTDHAGIATQMVVERRLAERGNQDRRSLGRDAFLAEVWAWKAESGGAIVGQLKRLGASCDWSRERFTMDESLSTAVRKVFVRLHKEGLIYRDKRLVNWDPKLLTAVSDIEVLSVETKGHLWHICYPIVDERGQPTDETIVVATTRPETMLGDSGVAVHPSDERYSHLVGRCAKLPLLGRLIPVVADDYSDPEKGTGAVKITPAHDFNDFDVGKRHGLAIINIFDAEARLDLSEVIDGKTAEDRHAGELATLQGMPRDEARKRIVALLEEAGAIAAIEPISHAVPHGERSGAAIEPRLTDQWYVDAATLAKPALAAVGDGRTRLVPKQFEKTFFDWLNNIQPWCVSRQLWWGHQIPAWYGPDGTVFVEETEEAARHAATLHFGHAVELTRDDDVLDTWFSSALWPFSTLGWPVETDELERRYPTDVLVTGFDIIFFWVARMMMMGLHLIGDVPFRDVYLHALVRDEKGAKMSKSKGNVLDPLGLIEEYGADALRFTLAAMAAQGRDIKLSPTRVDGYRSFATKVWNAARFAGANGCARRAGFEPGQAKSLLNRWIIGETARAHAEVSAAIDAYRFNDAAAAVYRFGWNTFCDWAIELSKPVLQAADVDPGERAETQATIAFVLDELLKLLHPFMPFITEEVWRLKGLDGGPARETLLTLAPWSDLSGLRDEEAQTEIGWVVDLVTEIRSVRTEMGVSPGANVPLLLLQGAGEEARRVSVWGETLKRLSKLSSVEVATAVPPNSVQLTVGQTVAALPLGGIVDFAAEKQRLSKDIAKQTSEAEKIKAKLANADFLGRAPAEIVDEQRERLEEIESRRAKLELALSRLAA